MYAIRNVPLALLAPASLCAMTLTGPTAQAAVTGDEDITSFGFSITPSTVAAGGQVTLRADGCPSRVRVSSAVFDDVTIRPDSSATAVVDWDAKPGASYTVKFRCKDETGTTQLTIATRDNGGWRPTNPPVHHGVKAGIGGSFGDLDFGEIALGAALIAGALGSALHFSRRRPADGEHS
ncbi:hypothetical protein [Streptomyces sp. KLOTTS4A1]|uniref:hypothetical protein n=1 Tax=Streptomyces sp. KLOTTS4A1 TaxID=3390996 RepID=UPI0039F5EC73